MKFDAYASSEIKFVPSYAVGIFHAVRQGVFPFTCEKTVKSSAVLVSTVHPKFICNKKDLNYL